MSLARHTKLQFYVLFCVGLNFVSHCKVRTECRCLGQNAAGGIFGLERKEVGG
jgi:hypothetical protein